jgi:dihydrodipicolinate synthase/N-acetylneuraminate lyase
MFRDNDKFRGVVPPLVTLLNPDEEIDEQGTEKLIEHVISGGVHGIFLMGTTGEGMRIRDRECEKVIRIATSHVGGRAAVLVGCSDFGTRRTLERIHTAERMGADGAVVTLSYYLPGFSREEIVRYYRQLAAESRIPVFIYNLPLGHQSTIELDTIDELSNVENIAGIKDSSQDQAHLSKLIEQFKGRDDLRIFVGTEVLMVESLMSGAHGCVPSIGNVRPDLCVNLYEAIQNRDLERVKVLEKEMLDTRKRVYASGPSWLSYIAGIKSALSALGISGQTITEPYRSAID